MPDSPHVINVTDENFQAEVFDRSQTTPVVVDFWATWCQPCLMLAPVLEKLADEFEGRFVLVKAETSEAAGAAGQFNVSSIPALFAVVNGEVVDMLVGGLPEPQLRDWIERIISADSLREAEQLEDASPEAAEAKYRALLQQDDGNDAAKIGLARVCVKLEQLEEAKSLIEQLEARGFLEPEAEKVKAALQFAEADPVDLDSLQAQVDANPNDLPAAFKLAQGQAAAGQHEAALQTALGIIERSKTGVGDEARQLMVDLFHALPDDSPLTTEYRRKLSMALY